MNELSLFDNNTSTLDQEKINDNNARCVSQSQLEIVYNQNSNRLHEAEDIVEDDDVKELTRRQLEANEETIRSEDIQLFLQEMRQSYKPIDTTTTNNVTYKGKSSDQRLVSTNIPNNADSSPYKEVIDPFQDAALQAMTVESTQMSPPDGGWAWLIVLASFFCMIIIDGICFNYGLLVPDMMNSFIESDLMPYIWPGSLISGFYMSIGPIASALSNQFDFRPVAMAGAIISGLAILLSSFMNNLLAFILFFGVFGGIGFGLIYLPAIAIVGHWFHEKRPVAVGLALCGSGGGTLLFGQLIPLLMDIFTWKGIVILISAVCVQALVLIALFRPLELHLRLQQLSKIRSKIHKMNYKEHKLQQMEHKEKVKEEKILKKSEKQKLKEKSRVKNNRVVIYRGNIMEKIIEEKKRQRTVSMGTLDGMFITRDNELVQPSKSSIDLYEKPILSVNTINRITETVVKRLQNTIKKHGPNGVFTINNVGDNRSEGIETNINLSGSQFECSLPQLVQEYIDSQLSLPMTNNQYPPSNSHYVKSRSLQRQQSVKSDSSSKTSYSQQGYVLQEGAKAVIQSSIRKEMMRPLQQKEAFFTGSMRQLTNNTNDIDESTKRSQVSLNAISVFNASLNESGNRSILDGIELNQFGPEGDVYSNQYAIDSNQPNDSLTANNNEAPFQTFMKDLLDVNLLLSPTFQLMSISSISSMLGVFIPFFFLPCYLTSNDMPLSIAGQLISYVGIANTVGRIFATMYIEKAWSSNYPWADCLWINNFALILAGIAACSVPFLIHNYVALICVMCIYGLCVAGFVSLKSILVVELLGVDRLTNAFGFLLIFQGIATICGPPIAATICDAVNGRHEVAFYLAGVSIILSGIMCCPLRLVARFEQKRLEKRYGRVGLDDVNRAGMDNDVEMPNEGHGKDKTDAYPNNAGIQTIDREEAGVKVVQDNLREVAEEPVLDPVVEEEEVDEYKNNNDQIKSNLFEIRKVE